MKRWVTFALGGCSIFVSVHTVIRHRAPRNVKIQINIYGDIIRLREGGD